MQITVIGAGVFGAWCAWFLSERGHPITLIEQYGPANARASSADHSRIIRCGYGPDDLYSRWAHSSLADWRMLEERCGRALIIPSGALFFGPPDNRYISASAQTLARLEIAAETLDADTLRQRHPQINADGLGNTLYEPGAAVVRARAAVQALVARLVDDHRVRYRLARVAAVDESSPATSIRLITGEALESDLFVFACGPWLPALFPDAVGLRLRVTRQEVLHYGVPPGSAEFAVPHLPVWVDFSAGLYGVPDIDARGFKVGVDRHGPALDPDTYDRAPRPDVVARTRTWIAQRFPALSRAPLVDAHVCQYENTQTGDFLIDQHPTRDNVWIVGGGSGHGFKHGPAVGRYVAGRILDGTPTEPRFALSAKGAVPARAVY